MPPKRKNKASKASPTTSPSKTQPAHIRTSSASNKRKHSVQGVKTSSRLQPSEPLHMTTRGAAKAASNHTSSAASSVANSSSRRSSLNDAAQFVDGDFDVEDERPSKRSRKESGSPADSTSSVTDHIVEPPIPGDSEPMSRAASNASKTSTKKRRASGDSSQSSKTVSARANGVPAQSESDGSDKQPRRKKRKTTETEPDPADPAPELTDASTAPGSPEQMLEIQSNQNLQNVLPTNSVDAPAKATRRLPGRRRQPHPDVNVETDLRRQLNIKMSYRSLAKIQKTLLEELSNRTTNNLDTDPEYHTQCPEYPGLMAGLDKYRESRLNQVHAERRLKLEQLDRLRKAEEHIQKEQYINRFEDLRDDLLLQCYHRMKQIEREQKGREGSATDDEQNVIEPTHLDFPTYGTDDRLGSKFASRSRAYIETERMLDKEILRQDFQRRLNAFVRADEDVDDSSESLPGGFAVFTGPDRTEAMAHYNVSTLVDAAFEVEKTPPPAPELPKVLPNEQADALLILATLSAEILQEPVVKDEQHHQEKVPSQVAPPTQAETPAPQVELNRAVTPIDPPSAKSAAMSLETPSDSPTKMAQAQVEVDQSKPLLETIGNTTPMGVEAKVTKIEPPTKVSTHRIMDILNDDVEVPVSKSRESQPPAREETPYATPLLQRRTVELNHSSQNGSHREEARVRHQEQSDNDQPMPDSEETEPHRMTSSPPRDYYWSNRNFGGARDDSSLPKLNPIDRIREMLERKARNEGLAPPLSRRERAPPSDYRQEVSSTRRDSNDRSQTPARPLSRAFSPQERSNTTGRESRRPSVGGINASSSNGTQSYDQSPRTTHAPFPPLPPRQHSQEHPSPYLDNARRLSGSQASQPAQYGGGPAQPYPHDRNRSGPTPPTHQSPYPPPNSQNLPSISQALPAKPPGPPPAAPIKFRFAPYEPLRPSYPSPQAAKYAPTSQPPHSEPVRPGPNYLNSHHSGPHHPGSHQPPSHYPDPHRPGQSHNGPPPPSQYPGSYNGGPTYQGYVPPAGTFTAPPPPQQAHTMSQYPPLKFQQYGGQPILPASMAPPHSHPQGLPPHSQPGPPHQQQHGPPHSQPGPPHQQTLSSHSHSLPAHSQPPHAQSPHAQAQHLATPYSQGPSVPTYSQPSPNHMNLPTSGPPSYSPPAPGPLNPQFDHVTNMPHSGHSDRPGESQQRPRRQYRSYHAPGTQFRTYQGPDTGGRRRGI